jgi:hypothetical protein
LKVRSTLPAKSSPNPQPVARVASLQKAQQNVGWPGWQRPTPTTARPRQRLSPSGAGFRRVGTASHRHTVRTHRCRPPSPGPAGPHPVIRDLSATNQLPSFANETLCLLWPLRLLPLPSRVDIRALSPKSLSRVHTIQPRRRHHVASRCGSTPGSPRTPPPVHCVPVHAAESDGTPPHAADNDPGACSTCDGLAARYTSDPGPPREPSHGRHRRQWPPDKFKDYFCMD